MARVKNLKIIANREQFTFFQITNHYSLTLAPLNPRILEPY